MLTVYRSNRAEFLAQLLGQKLRLEPPSPWETVQVVVNTWPTSRWLGERLAVELGGIAANLRFPFPGSRLRQIVNHLLDEDPAVIDPWQAANLVWPVLELLPDLVERGEAVLLESWLQGRGDPQHLDAPLWQLGRAIADSFDDLTLYRPAMVAAWCAGDDLDGRGQSLPAGQRWQPQLFRQLQSRLGVQPFGLRLIDAIERLRRGTARVEGLVGPLRLFGLSSSAPLQVHLLQALAASLPVEIYLLTPCQDLWQRCRNRRQELSDAVALSEPFALDWVMEAPGLEGRFGRLGAEFQQLLEGTGEAQLGSSCEQDLFFLAATAARQRGQAPRLLEQLQEHLVEPRPTQPLQWTPGDRSLEFHPCPGRLRQVQIVRDRLLQLLAEDTSLEPRHILVMTPQVERMAPLLASVFGDSGGTCVRLPWRLTDRSLQSEAGLSAALLQMLRLGGERLTASALETLLENRALQEHFGLQEGDNAALNRTLQSCGFRWGLDGSDRGGEATHSLAWAIDRLLLGLVLPDEPGLAVGDCAPLEQAGSLEMQGRWINLLTCLRRSWERLRQPRTAPEWAPCLARLLEDLFGEGGERTWELASIREAIVAWGASAGDGALRIPAPVVASILEERLAADSGRFGHRSGALTISALEPMRAIPHRVIVLMGLDAEVFPRQRWRPGFDLMEATRRLGDPHPADQDRYVLLEALLSARDHLVICWTSRDERSGGALPPPSSVRQWQQMLASELGEEVAARLQVNHPANPLDRGNFLPGGDRPPASCDRRQLEARRRLDQPLERALPLALQEPPPPPPGAAPEPMEAWSDLHDWLRAPQEQWLRELGLRPKEWAEPTLDFEAACLDERQRSALLRGELDRSGPAGSAKPPEWARLSRGRGLLPALGAGRIEAEELDQRWKSLQALLEPLGPRRNAPLSWLKLAASLEFHGDTLVAVRIGKPRPRDRLGLWLDLLLASAAGAPPRTTLLIARDTGSFVIAGEWMPPPAQAAGDLLETLCQWRDEHHRHCWPVPPATGWAYATAETRKPGSGASHATARWERHSHAGGERQEESLAFAFGRHTPATDLLEGRFGDFRGLALALWQPLLQAERTP